MQNDPTTPFGGQFLTEQGDKSFNLFQGDDSKSFLNLTSSPRKSLLGDSTSNDDFDVLKTMSSSFSPYPGGARGGSGITASPMPMSPFTLALEGARTERLRRLLYQGQDMLLNNMSLPFSGGASDLLDPPPLHLSRGVSLTDPFRDHAMEQLSSFAGASSAAAAAASAAMPPPPSLLRSCSSFGAPSSPTTAAATRMIREAYGGGSGGGGKPTFLTPEDLQAQVGVPKPNEEDDAEVHKRTIRKWKLNFDDLAAFRLKYGHCDVPTQVTEFKALTQWIKRQRYHYTLRAAGKPSSLTEERIQMLESIGFVWNSHCAAWEEKFAQLIMYRQKNGHCNVPRSYPPNQQLSTWVKRQRRQYNARHLDANRVRRLESIGFVWNMRRAKSGEAKEAAVPYEPLASVKSAPKPPSASTESTKKPPALPKLPTVSLPASPLSMKEASVSAQGFGGIEEV